MTLSKFLTANTAYATTMAMIGVAGEMALYSATHGGPVLLGAVVAGAAMFAAAYETRCHLTPPDLWARWART